MTLRSCAAAFFVLSVLPSVPTALAEHASIWGGGGAGSFVSGAPSDVEGQKFGALSVSFAGDRLRLRYLRGSFEREKGIAHGVGDADVDYAGGDVVLTRRWTGLPVDVAIGAALYKEARPSPEAGGRVFDRRWGPHASLLREFPVWKPIAVWTELDVDSAKFRQRQVMVLLDAGLGVRF